MSILRSSSIVWWFLLFTSLAVLAVVAFLRVSQDVLEDHSAQPVSSGLSKAHAAKLLQVHKVMEQQMQRLAALESTILLLEEESKQDAREFSRKVIEALGGEEAWKPPKPRDPSDDPAAKASSQQESSEEVTENTTGVSAS
eukprot:TRINITY_DN9957_c1_g2_i2.p2 TRINITY_DN9957_c1_g2~~TRINITY_DN9957_c1_g2_i2.p2  ORF type:complete len:141 (-),score=48.61 TRINITY_DN9957_c1_g2_i2:265-687(-)